MPVKNYMPTFISTSKYLAEYIAKHEHKMVEALEQASFASEEEKRQIKELVKQISAASLTLHKLDGKF